MDRHADERTNFRFVHMHKAQPEHQLPVETLARLAIRLTAPGAGDRRSHVPAGYTYLGQLIAHDLSFDLTTAGLGRRLSVRRLKQAASPSLDLDTLYGGGPVDEGSARFYAGGQGPGLITGRTTAGPGGPALEGWDLPRGDRGEPRRAAIPDPRNDDNLAIAQIHAALIRFHNRVADEDTTASDPYSRFAQARDIVTRHVQWIVWHDYLPRICDPAVLDAVRDGGRRAFAVGQSHPGEPPRMPLEFSAGVFRLGHSMVRLTYPWSGALGTISLEDLFRFSGRSGDLGGCDVLPRDCVAHFRRLFDFAEAGLDDSRPPEPIRARCIDTRLTKALRTLPPGTLGATEAPVEPREANLAFRNLMKARRIRLASGQDMAAFLLGKGIDLEPLTPQAIGGEGLAAVLGEDGLHQTPLWVYALREAELAEPHRLSDVGAWIVAETIHRAIEASRISIFDGSDWTPTLMHAGEDFSMAHLLLHAFGGELASLTPLEPPPPA